MKKEIKAVLCDLDGVLTRTASLHARAWKQLFDGLLHRMAVDCGIEFKAFDIAKDYPALVDGKPRLEGIRSYLKAYKIAIPEGKTGDSAEVLSVQGLAKKKNELFHDLLAEEGVEKFDASIAALRDWKARGMRLAVVSSSKNCRPVLKAAGISSLFEVIVDGSDAEQEKLKGKPYPHTFLYAAKLLEMPPEDCAVVEDAAAGIEAAVKGNFGLAVGIKNENNFDLLQKAKAGCVLQNLGEISYTGKSLRFPVTHDKLKKFSTAWLSKTFKRKRPVFFWDYDGTLTPIAAHPEDALLPPPVREKLLLLSSLAPVTIISGRDMVDVKALVGIDDIFYAGSHGFEIEGPGDENFSLPEGSEIISVVQEIIPLLKKKLQNFTGIQVESKKFAVAVHYRNAPGDAEKNIIETVQEVVSQFPQLKTGEGKKVLEIRSVIDWDKGKAMRWICDKLELNRAGFYHFYVGDDVTDEDAFRALPEQGMGILVGTHAKSTYADYTITGQEVVSALLDEFIKATEKKEEK